MNISFPIQILIFLVLSGALLFLTRPLAIKKFKLGAEKTNVDSLIGKHALLVKGIGEFEKGEAQINGQRWSACAADQGEIKAGTRCEVIRVEGVRLIVRPLPAEQADSES